MIFNISVCFKLHKILHTLFEKQLILPMASLYKSYKPYEGTSYISQTLVLEAFYNGYNDFP